jgi:hypothetical protein
MRAKSAMRGADSSLRGPASRQCLSHPGALLQPEAVDAWNIRGTVHDYDGDDADGAAADGGNADGAAA